MLSNKNKEKYTRPQVDLKDNCERFKIQKYDFSYQYCHLYFCRFMSLLPFLQKASLNKWNCHLLDDLEKEKSIKSSNKESIPILRELKDAKIELECIAIGLIMKEMKNRPTILDEYLQEIDDSTKNNLLKDYMSDDDKLYIEDNSSRMPLIINENIIFLSELLSGTMIAVKGYQNSGGSFFVKDYTLALPPERILIKENKLLDINLPIYLGFISGINIGSDIENSLSLQLFRDFIMGISTNNNDKFLSSRIAQLIIAGNSINLLDTARETSTGTGTKLIVNDELLSSRLTAIDAFISQLASSISIIIIPGENDPVPISLPQPQFQPYIFKNARNYQSFRSLTNPCLFNINNIRITGISGDCISKISLYTSYSDPLEALKFCIRSRNLAPTCPDISPCYPTYESDPFALNYPDDEFPQVIFAGNQEEFKLYRFPNNGPMCFTIPKFSVNPRLVLLDINTFETKTILFK